LRKLWVWPRTASKERVGDREKRFGKEVDNEESSV